MRIGTRHARIKALLLDQSVLRGVGNIYADESLWRAKIHPARLGLRLKKLEIQTLHRFLRDVLQKAILLRGSSIINFLDGDGREGDYQREHQAYGREGEKCRRCGARIRRIIVAGRSSFFCPQCQRGRWKKQKQIAQDLRKQETRNCIYREKKMKTIPKGMVVLALGCAAA